MNAEPSVLAGFAFTMISASTMTCGRRVSSASITSAIA